MEADDQTAIAWFDLAAQRGNTDAMINLGIMYETGEGITANAEKAAEMYRQAAEKGDMFGASKYMQFQELGVVPAPNQQGVEGVSSLVLKQVMSKRLPRSAARSDRSDYLAGGRSPNVGSLQNHRQRIERVECDLMQAEGKYSTGDGRDDWRAFPQPRFRRKVPLRTASNNRS